jgi:hypothetical protein
MMRLSGSVKLRCDLGSGWSDGGAAGLPGFLRPSAWRCCSFSASMNQTRSDLNSDYSDRLLGEGRSGDFVFPGQRRDKPLSGKAMELMLRRMKIENATVHGFRSAFRDWAGNETAYPRELIETALAHVIGDKAEQAYRRRDALEKRRQLMEAWASYCTAGSVQKVVPFRGKA